MKSTRDIVAEWPIGNVVEVTRDWTDFERVGAIGDCCLRRAACAEMDRFGMGNGAGVTRMMHDIAFEAYRLLAQQHPAMKQ